MALPSRRRPENAPGDLYVDGTCIDCDTCRWMAPATFARVGGQSAVARQPRDAVEWRSALQALAACPTASIGTMAEHPEFRSVLGDFPLRVAGNVFHCGFHAESSFGATPYLVVRPRGNVLVDVPRFNEPLADRIGSMGGVRWIFLTHRDDVADHRKWAKRFGAERVLHEADVTPATREVERPVAGTGPVRLDADLLVLPTPGHTRGSACLLHADRFLFTGDHLAWDTEGDRPEAWPDVCWYDWGEQTASVRRLAEHRFEWVLPGHGRRGRAEPARMRDLLLSLADWMEGVGRTGGSP